jgi:hypothetical protein
MTDSAFHRLWSQGYRRLIPIVPPDAPVSERSTLHKRLNTPQDARGKTPGIRGNDGRWFSFDWTPYEADEADLARWSTMGAGVGVKTGAIGDGLSLVAIDADTLNRDFAGVICDELDERFGKLPVRVGQFPKALYLIRVRGTLPYLRIEFGPDIAEAGKPPRHERVEVLTDGRQFVADGVHPKTGKPYSWPRELVDMADLPIIDPDDIVAALDALRNKLPAASKLIAEGAGAEVSQAALTGPLQAVRAAVAATPNTSNHFPSRESYRDMGYAIKAALPDHPDEAFEIFQGWCDRWSDGVNDHDIVAADWRRMKPPFRRGASWLYEQAETYGHFDKSSVWFEPIAETEPNPFEIADAKPPASDLYPLLTLEDIMSRPPPVFLIDRHIPKVSCGFLYSVPGAGKSFLALDAALHIAAGLDEWNGDKINADPNAVVIYIASEGSFGFRNRAKAWCKARGISKSFPKRFLLIEQTIDFMHAEDIDKLLRTVRAAGYRPCLVIVDTVSRAMPGADENLQKEMTLFVRACDRVKDAFQCAVWGVHHAGKNGDMRGSTVLLGAGDFVFKLDRKKGATIGNLYCEKQKDAPDGWEEPYRFDTVALGDGETSLVVTRADLHFGPALELTPATSRAVLEAMRAAWETGEPWSASHVAKERYAIRRMVADFGFDASGAESLLRVWEQSGLISNETASGKAKRKGYKVGAIPDNLSEGEALEGVFD